MGIYVLDRPDGTYAYNPGAMQNFNPIFNALGDRLNKDRADQEEIRAKAEEDQKRAQLFDQAAREATKNNMEMAGINVDANGNQSLTYRRPEVEKKDGFNTDNLMAHFLGLKSLKDIGVDPEAVAPRTVGQAEGGQVLAPPKSRVEDGVIYDANGKMIGETTQDSIPANENAYTAALKQSIFGEDAPSQGDMARAMFKIPQRRQPDMSGSNDLLYRDSLTGEIVDPETAIADIQNGGDKYIVSRVEHTFYGPRERPLIKPPDLTQDEKAYVNTGERISGRLDSMLNDVIPKLKNGKWGAWQSAQAQSLPFAAISDPDVQKYKSALVALKADIPFLRGGKQLTATEAKRVDVLLNPFGKNPEQFQQDMETFKNEFGVGREIMTRGVRGFPENKSSERQAQGGQYQVGQEIVNSKGQRAIVRTLGPDGQPDDIDLIE